MLNFKEKGSSLPKLAAYFLISFILLMNSAQAQVPAGMTLGAFFQGLSAVISQMEASARTLLAQGNNALAQQQLLLAGVLKGTIEQAKTAYADSLDLTFSKLDVAEQNAFGDLISAINSVADIEKSAARDVQSSIYRAQGAANQILNRLPFGTKAPVFYGVNVRDLINQPRDNPSDIEVLGFMLADSRLNFKKPQVIVGGIIVADELVSFTEDRLQIQLSEEIKSKIDYGNSPCRPRKTFPISIKVFYGKERGFFPIKWTSETSANFNANALPGAEIYEFKAVYDGIRSVQSLKTETFTTVSGNVTVGCENSASTTHAFTAPPGATELNCSSGWINTSNLKNQSQNCVAAGGTASATGDITGLDRQCYVVGQVIGWVVGKQNICNCPGGGSGSLQISGTYKVQQTTTENLTNAALPIYQTAEGKILNISLPIESSLKKSAIRVAVFRRGCTTQLDTLMLNLNNNNTVVNQTSTNGGFKAQFRNEQLTIEQVR